MTYRAFFASCAVLIIAGAGQSQELYGTPPLIEAQDCTQENQSWAEAALDRSLEQPLGLPAIPHPEQNPPTLEKIELGRKIFFDRRLSINKTTSCAMCHVPEQGFVSWDLATAVGVEGRGVKRNAPTLVNVAYAEPLFHDGRDHGLENQFVGPLIALNEMANPSVGYVVRILNEMPEYQPLFEAAFGGPPSIDTIGKALGVYQRSLTLGNSAFDQWYYGGDENALDASAKRGFELFQGEAGCISCHQVGESDALFTDMQFHDTGFGRMREDRRQNPPPTLAIEVAPGVVHDVDFGLVKSVSATREADLGRYEVTEAPEDRWKFRTPSLRNVAVTRPYMHDGAFSEISEVLDFYNQGGVPHPDQSPLIRPLGLDPQELADIEAFLHSLTSDGLECLVFDARSQMPDNF